MRKSVIVGMFLSLLIGNKAYSQYSEAGIFLGGSWYNGDLQPNWFSIKFINPALGAIYRYNLNPHWALKGNVYYGTVSAEDIRSDNTYQENRNLSFKSSMLDFSVEAEFNFFPFELGYTSYYYTPYVFTGLSLYHFNPKAKLGNDWYELQPLGTEGQGTTLPDAGKHYALTQVAIPIGGGFKFNFTRFGLGIEMGVRKTFTDYIDDVSTVYADKVLLGSENGIIASTLSDRSSPDNTMINRQRGNSKNKDWYSFAGIIISFRINQSKGVCRSAFDK